MGDQDIVKVELICGPDEGPEAARSHARHRALPAAPGALLLEVRADTLPERPIDARVSLSLPPDTLFLAMALTGEHHGTRGHLRPDRDLPSAQEISADRYLLAPVGSGEWTVRRAPRSHERLVGLFLEPTWIEQTLGPFGLARPLLDVAHGRRARDGFTAVVSPLMRRAALEALSSPYHGEVQRLAVLGKTLEMLAACAEDLGASAPRDDGAPVRTRHLAHAAEEILADRLASPPTLTDLAAALGTDARTLSASFRAVFGHGVGDHVADLRLAAARERLRSTEAPVKQIAADSGYAHVSNFNAAFARKFGVPPARYRRLARGR